jgi:uncharacterized protein DUF4331
MSDHLDSPGPITVETAMIGPPNGDPRTDITDVYAFQKPGDPKKSILIMNVNPLAPALAAAFNPNALYELNVDTNADAIPDRALRVRFSEVEGGMQTATVHLAVGHDATFPNDGGMAIFSGAPVTPIGASTPIVTVQDQYKFFAGIRSDPFFFDLLGFIAGLTFNQGDFFKDKNVFGIALEVPNVTALGSNPKIGVWGRTLFDQNGTFVNDDRAGRPAINTVFNHGVDKNIFNNIDPVDDQTAKNHEGQTFVDSFTGTIVALSALGPSPYTTAQAKGIALFLLPDILTYDYSSSAGFPNGRKLTDDVINDELGLLTNGSTLTDDASAHTDLLADFPYLGSPH